MAWAAWPDALAVRRAIALHGPGESADGGQMLGQFVVQFARQIRPLALLQGNQLSHQAGVLAQQYPLPLLGHLAFGDVLDRADHAQGGPPRHTRSDTEAVHPADCAIAGPHDPVLPVEPTTLSAHLPGVSERRLTISGMQQPTPALGGMFILGADAHESVSSMGLPTQAPDGSSVM
jgi:hypothetical protein